MNLASDAGYRPVSRADRKRFATAVRGRVLAGASDLCPELVPQSMSIEIRPQRHYFANSNHLKLLISGRTEQGRPAQYCLYAKRSRSAKIEYANLVTLWESYFRGDDVNRIPKPLAHWADHDLLLTECIADHPAFLPWLIRCTSPLGIYTDRQAAETRMQRIADWLIAFQSIASTSRQASSAPSIDDIEEALKDLTAAPFVSADTGSRVAMWLSDARSHIATWPPVLSHGDFTARNILMDQASVTVLDWENPLFARHPLYDVQAFLVNLERRLNFPLFSHRRVEELKEAFLTRYLAQSRHEFDEHARAVLRVVVLIHELKAEHRALQNRRTQAIVRRRQSFMRYLLAEIEKETNHG